MLSLLARNWWLLALRGVLAITFGILAFIWPGATVAALVLVFAAYALFFGILLIVLAFRLRGMGRSIPQNRQRTA